MAVCLDDTLMLAVSPHVFPTPTSAISAGSMHNVMSSADTMQRRVVVLVLLSEPGVEH